MSDQMHWYIVQTYSGYENKAKLALDIRVEQNGMQDLFEEVFIPTEMVTEVRNGKKRQVKRKFYNGYIFVKMQITDQSWHLVKNTPKIVGFLGNQLNPVPVPEHEVKRITDRIEEGQLKSTTSYSFSQGDRVRIIDGNFSDFTGSVEEVNEEKEKLRVVVEIFGRPNSVEFDYDQVIAVDEG
jgi:transcriptional antiterminator NusG